MRRYNNLGFGQRLRGLLGCGTQGAFAKKIAVTQQQLSLFLSGQVPGPEILLRISEVTGRSLNWLLTGEEAPLTAAKEKAEALAQALKEKAPGEIIAEGPPPLAEADRDSGKLVESIKELLPPAFGDDAGLLIEIIDYLKKATPEDRRTLQNLMDSLCGGDEEIRRHLTYQLKLIKELADFKKEKTLREGLPKEEEEEKKRAAG